MASVEKGVKESFPNSFRLAKVAPRHLQTGDIENKQEVSGPNVVSGQVSKQKTCLPGPGIRCLASVLSVDVGCRLRF
jgi:hypothetical protein